MATNPNVALQLRPLQIQDNRLAQLAQIQALEGNQANAEYRGLQMAQLKRANADEDAIRDIYRANGATPEAVGPALRNAGFGKQASEIEGQTLDRDVKRATLDKTKAETAGAELTQQKTKLENGLKEWEMFGQIASGIRDQPSLDAARAQVQKLGGDPSKLPPTFDPNTTPAFIQQQRMQALPIKEQMSAELERLKFGEMERNNLAQNKISQQNANSAATTARAAQTTAEQGKWTTGQDARGNPILVATSGARMGQSQPVMDATTGKPMQGADATAAATNALGGAEAAIGAAGALPQATAGMAGNALDSIAGFFGASTKGAEAGAQLDVLAGKLTGAVPKFSGPSSDRDVALYKQMAGDVANPNKPIAVRQAALRTVTDLQFKAMEQNGVDTKELRTRFEAAAKPKAADGEKPRRRSSDGALPPGWSVTQD